MIDPNDPASPSLFNKGFTGLTKREYFAAIVLQALDIGASPPENAAKYAVQYADALIAELNKEPKS